MADDQNPPLNGASVLLVEDEPLLRRQLAAFLERQGADVTAVGDLAAARRSAALLPHDFALLDVNLPDGLGTDLLREGAFSANTGVVVMTSEGGVAGAVEAMKLGALSYLTKPFENGELLLVFGQVRRERRAKRLEQHRREDQDLAEGEVFFGTSLAGLRSILDRILAADRRMESGLPPVLIQGETGSGKTLLARWLHRQGPRAEQPLVEVNCPALPETLAESELFGHERGAFTDARSARIGLFEAANGGTLFLDELSSLSLPIQAKVLKVIEDGSIRRLGGNKSIPVDVRVIAASNLDLKDMVAAGRFREDLLHRLDLFRLQLPPLRARAADIVPLAETLLKRACRRHRLDPRPITEEGRRRLAGWPWPGNVRELTHELERALVFEDGPLAFTHLERLGAGHPATSYPADEWFNAAFQFPESGFNLETAIDRIVDHALAQSGGNVSAAARLLGVSRDVVRYRIAGRSGGAAKVGE
jgi:DNA-binding NtrC family response regulator